MVSERTDEACARAGPPELLPTRRMWQIPSGSYLYTNLSISFHCKHVAHDRDKELGALSVLPTEPMLTRDIYTPVCPFLTAAKPPTLTNDMIGVWGWVCVQMSSPLRSFSKQAL